MAARSRGSGSTGRHIHLLVAAAVAAVGAAGEQMEVQVLAVAGVASAERRSEKPKTLESWSMEA